MSHDPLCIGYYPQVPPDTCRYCLLIGRVRAEERAAITTTTRENDMEHDELCPERSDGLLDPAECHFCDILGKAEARGIHRTLSRVGSAFNAGLAAGKRAAGAA